MKRSNSYHRLIILGIALCSFSSLFAQTGVCGFDDAYRQQLANPETAERIQAINAKVGQVQQSIQSMRNSGVMFDIVSGPNGDTYQIPVVVHVIHRGEALGNVNNPTDETIQSMITFLNQVYAGENVNGGGGVRIPIQFALAKRSPDCQATSGILRVDASENTKYADGVTTANSGPGLPDADLKALSRWPADQYYNIWIVHKIYNSDPNRRTNGYALFPGGGNRDGTVLIGLVTNNTSLTLPHEMGHAMALYHTFQGDNGDVCPANNDCATDGDKVCDTDPHTINFLCPNATDQNSCTNANWGLLPKNIMGYFRCTDRFTNGQGDRALATFIAERYNLAASKGSTPPPSNTVEAIEHSNTNQKQDISTGIGPTQVKLNTLYYKSSGYFASSRVAYEDKTCAFAGTVDAGSTTNAIEVTTSNGNRQLVKVWLDLNGDNTYSTDELIGRSTTPLSQPQNGSYTHTIVIPATKLNAKTTKLDVPLRLRVASDFVESATYDYDYNAQLIYGQMEDFAVSVSNSSLPVNFATVNAVIKNNTLTATWQSKSEQNNEKYLIQVSKDGKIFYSIGEQFSKAPKGISSLPLDYSFSISYNKISGIFASLLLISLFSFTKKKMLFRIALMIVVTMFIFLGNSCNKNIHKPSNVEANLFLRIAQVDKDGTKKFSKVVTVERK